MNDDMEILKEDLKHQLKFEHMDWDYFIETAERAKTEAEKLNENFIE